VCNDTTRTCVTTHTLMLSGSSAASAALPPLAPTMLVAAWPSPLNQPTRPPLRPLNDPKRCLGTPTCIGVASHDDRLIAPTNKSQEFLTNLDIFRILSCVCCPAATGAHHAGGCVAQSLEPAQSATVTPSQRPKKVPRHSEVCIASQDDQPTDLTNKKY
jgi:hypothetical protein